jgi:transforming growth factor-beta-induced protein
MKTHTIISRPNFKIRLRSFTMVILLSFGLLSCDDDDPGSAVVSEPTIVEVAQSDDRFDTLVGALESAELVSTLEGSGPFTVFAPTDEAFDALPDGLLGSLSKEQLTTILTHHVLAGAVESTDLMPEQEVDALDRSKLFITVDGTVSVNDLATVTQADIQAGNGVIHVIDQVLLPDSFVDIVGLVSKRYQLQTLESAVVGADLVGALKDITENGYTVFAPYNDAFTGVDVSGLTVQQLTDILTYHVVPAKVLSSDLDVSQEVPTLNGATILIEVSDGEVRITDDQGNTYQVIEADIEGTNGVVHIIDGILMPAGN